MRCLFLTKSEITIANALLINGELGGACLSIRLNFMVGDQRSRTTRSMFPALLVDGSIAKMVIEIMILGFLIDSKLTFKSHVMYFTASVSCRIGILWKTGTVFRDISILSRWSLILPVLEYCFPVWMSTAVSHCHFLIRSFVVYLGWVVVLFALICVTDAEYLLCLCSIVFVVLLVSRSGTCFLSLFHHTHAIHPFSLVSPRCRTSQS